MVLSVELRRIATDVSKTNADDAVTLLTASVIFSVLELRHPNVLLGVIPEAKHLVSVASRPTEEKG